jgi:sulfite reductase alpha subunit-like flavoprotein
MADEATVSPDVPSDEPEPSNPDGSKSHAAQIHEEVATILKKEGAATVRKRVIADLVEEKLAGWKKLAVDGLAKLKTLRQSVAKLEREGEQKYGLDKKPIGPPVFTKKQAEEYEKEVQKLKKLQTALDLALSDKADYSKLQECV